MPTAQNLLHQEISTLYSNHHRWLLGWLCKKLGNTFDAADLAQDTFSRILVSRDLAAVREPRAYLTTVAKGLLINWWQRQALERAYLDALSIWAEQYAPSPEQRLLLLEALHEMDALLDALPPKVRQVFLLSQLEGLKYEEIATLIDVSLITVKRYMKQAFLQCLLLMS